MTVATGATARQGSSRAALAWIASVLSALVVSINLSVMSVAFDSLRDDFPGTRLSVMGWVLSVYTIVFGAVLVPAGRIADHIGRRRIFLAGLVTMSISSTLAGAAPAVWLIIVGRVGQGVAAACLVPSTLGLLLDAVAENRRATVTAMYSLVASLGGVLGPLVGALLIDRWSWRAAFYVAPALSAVAFAAGLRSLPDNRTRHDGPLPDLLGSLLVMLALSALSLGVLQGRNWGWTDRRILSAFALCVVAAVAFLQRSRRHPVPVLPVALMRLQSLGVANAAAALYGVATGALLFTTVLFARQVWDYSIIRSSLLLMPLAASSLLTSALSGRMGARRGERAIGVPGALLVATGLALLSWRLRGEPHFARDWLPGALAIGLGMGTGYPMIGAAAVRDVDRFDLSVASASNRMSLQIGNALGIALAIAVLGDAANAALLTPMRRVFGLAAFTAVGVAVAMSTLKPRPPSRP